MQIFLKKLDGKIMPINVHDDMKVDHLVLIVRNVLGQEEIDERSMVFGGKTLKLGETLKQLGIIKSSTIHLTQRLPGGFKNLSYLY
jgi:uncharacterized protein YajQ (UPF0234 family)